MMGTAFIGKEHSLKWLNIRRGISTSKDPSGDGSGVKQKGTRIPIEEEKDIKKELS